MTFVFYWLLVATPCFFIAYCRGSYLSFRISIESCEVRFFKNLFKQGLLLFVHDYFGVYCPWSWERAKRYRLADMRIFLGERGHCHEKLGHITAADCDNPEKQETIAQHTYISRATHWARLVPQLLFAPILVSVVITNALVDMIVEVMFRFLHPPNNDK